MKFNSVIPFVDFLKEHSCPRFILLIVEDPYEQKILIDRIFPSKNSLTFSRFRLSDHPVSKVLQALDSPFLMGGSPQVVLEEAQDVSKSDVDQILSLTCQDYVGNFLIVASHKKNKFLLSLVNEAEKKGILLDLSTEKVWEKEKRLSDFLKEQCLLQKKRIDEQAVRLLIERSQRDFAYLANELEKLFTYVGTKESITLSGVKCIGSYLPQETVWKVAEKLIWEKQSLFSLLGEEQMDSTFFHSLVAALRYQLQFGLKLVSVPSEKQISSLPQLASYSPWLISKRFGEAKKLGKDFFQKALLELFSMDLQSKNQVQDQLALLVLFEAKLLSTSQKTGGL